MSNCPSHETLDVFLANGFDESDFFGVFVAHLETCTECQHKLDAKLPRNSLLRRADSSTVDDGNWNAERARRIEAALREQDALPVDQKRHSSSSLPLPFVLGNYELLEVLGEGGMGVVYRAHQRGLNRTVALKTISPHRMGDPGLVARFRAEAESVAKLDHPGIVQVFDVGEYLGLFYFAMAFVPGETLAEKLRDGPMEPKAAAQLLREISNAVEFAHGCGIIHRDLKPSNILLDSSGSPRVADFGLARNLTDTSHITHSGQLLGTPSYMPPEQAQGKMSAVDQRSDIYSLGAILYQMLVGRPPFLAASSVDTLLQVVQDEPVSPRQLSPSIPRDLETICLKCLSKLPERRYDTALLLVEELDRFLQNKAILARPIGYGTQLIRLCRRNPVSAGLAASIAVVLILSTVLATSLAALAQRHADSVMKLNQKLVTTEASERQSKTMAENRTEIAMRTLETMLFDLQKAFARLPGEQESRRKLLQSAISSLSEITENGPGDIRIQHNRAIAMLGLAEVTMQVGDQNGQAGNTAANSLYEQAIQMFQDIHDANPDTISYQVSLADALMTYADTLADNNNFRDALKMQERAMPIRRKIAESFPDRADYQARLVLAEVELGEALPHNGKRKEGRESIESGYLRCREALKQFPNAMQLIDALALACERLGDWHYDFGELKAAHPYYEEFLHASTAFAEADPHDAHGQMQLSSAYERLGMYFFRRKELTIAREHFQKSLDVAERLSIAAPNNDLTQWEVSHSYSHVSKVCLAMGDNEGSRVASLKCVSLRRRLIKSDPDNPAGHLYLSQELKRLARGYVMEGNKTQAVDLYRECLDMERAFTDRTGSTQFQKDIDWLEGQLRLEPQVN